MKTVNCEKVSQGGSHHCGGGTSLKLKVGALTRKRALESEHKGQGRGGFGFGGRRARCQTAGKMWGHRLKRVKLGRGREMN